MAPLTLVGVLVVLATLGVCRSGESVVSFVKYGQLMSHISPDDNVATTGGKDLNENRVREQLVNLLINKIKISPNLQLLHDIITEQEAGGEGKPLVRKRRFTHVPPWAPSIFNLSPFRNIDDFYHTMTDLLFHTPGFVTGLLNCAAIFSPFYFIFGGGGVPRTSSPRTASSFSVTDEVMVDQIRTWFGRRRRPLQNGTRVDELDITAESMTSWLQVNVNRTDNMERVLGAIDAFRFLNPRRNKASQKSSAKEQRSDIRKQAEKNARRFLKNLWTRQPGAFGGKRASNSNSTSSASETKQNVDTAEQTSASKSTGVKQQTLDIPDPVVSSDPEVGTTEDVTPAEEKNIDIDTVVEDTMEALFPDGQGNARVVQYLQTYLPRLLTLLSENGFTTADFLETVNLEELTGADQSSLEKLIEDLQKSEKFVNALAAVLDVSVEELGQMGNMELLMKLRTVLM